MKKFSVLICILTVILCFCSCGGNEVKDDEPSAEREAASEDTYESTSQEDVSFAVKPIDFSIPYTFEESFDFITLPEFDSSKKNEDSSETFYMGEIAVMKKVYDSSNRDEEITVYEEDGKTVKTVIKYKYDDLKGFSFENYENGVCVEEYYITYDTQEEYANAACKMEADVETGGKTMEMYEFDKNGEVIKYIDNASFADLILNSVIGSLAG